MEGFEFYDHFHDSYHSESPFGDFVPSSWQDYNYVEVPQPSNLLSAGSGFTPHSFSTAASSALHGSEVSSSGVSSLPTFLSAEITPDSYGCLDAGESSDRYNIIGVSPGPISYDSDGYTIPTLPGRRIPSKPRPRAAQSGNNETKKYRCVVCKSKGIEFQSLASCKRHISDQHFPQFEYRCPVAKCPHNTVHHRIDKVRNHCRSVHLIAPSLEEINKAKVALSCPPICMICSKTVKSWNDLYKCLMDHCIIRDEPTAPDNLPDGPPSSPASNSQYLTIAQNSNPVTTSRSQTDSTRYNTTTLLPGSPKDETASSALSPSSLNETKNTDPTSLPIDGFNFVPLPSGQFSSHNPIRSQFGASGSISLSQASNRANAPAETFQNTDGDNEYFEVKRLKPMDWRSPRGTLQQPIGAVTSPSNLTVSQSTTGESHFSNTENVSPSYSMHTDITCPETDEFDIDARIPDGDDMDHLLNPTAHYRKLDMLEIRTANLCGVLEDPQVCEKSAVECLKSLAGVKEALSMLHGAGFCGNALSILVQDPSRTDVARSVHISLDQISNCILSEEIVNSPQFSPYRTHGTALQIVQDLVGNLSLGISHEADPEWLAYWRFMTTILSIGLVSFSGSHVCRFDENLWDSKMDKIPVGYGYSFTPRPLACLKNFIGGPIWILGADDPKANSKEMKISLTVEDLQELWGPIEMVGGAPGLSPILRTETGYIVPLRRQDQSDPSLREIECHWQMQIPDYIINLQERPILLNSSSQILIGTDSLNPTGLTPNLNCSLEIKRLQSSIISQLKYYDTRKAHNTFDGIDLQATGGFNFSFGPVIKYKRNPMRKWKTTIIYECKSQKIKLKPLLNLYVGLEVSACTGNAQRVTLWDALRLSQTKAKLHHDTPLCRHRVADPECIKKCWTRCHADDDIDLSVSIPTNGPISTEKVRSLIFDSILALEHTGIDHEKNLQAYWPFCDQPRTRSISATPSEFLVGTINNWFRIIKDTHSVATFPVISQRCLEYGNQQDHWYTRPCSTRENNLSSCTAFSTRLVLTPSLRSVCLEPEYDHRRYVSSIIVESMNELRLGGNIVVGDAALTVETVVPGEPNLLIAAASTNSIQNGWIKLATGTKFQEDLDLDLSTGVQVSLLVY